MPDRTTPHVTEGPAHERRADDAWARLRRAIADEYVAKLPDLLSVDEFARLAGMTAADVRQATMSAELIVSLRDGRYGIAPADNVEFLLQERLLRLPVRPSAPQGRMRLVRTLEVSTAAYERVWERAVRDGVSPQQVLDRLLLGTEPAAGLEPATARLQGECSTN